MISAFSKSIHLKINVQSDEIVLLGHADEAAGKMLQGFLILDISEPIKVKSVNLSFVGKIKVSWSEGGAGHHQSLHKQERTILSHTWAFVKPQLISANTSAPHKKSTLLSAGQHKWNFELSLPGNLAQTLVSDVASVSYRLKATIERSAFIQNTVKKRAIRIVRCILPSHYELVQSLEIHNTWAQKMVYDISVPSKLYAFNDTIPISFKISPIASHLKVHAIMASIKEYCTYTANGHTKTDTRIVRLIKVDHPFSEAVTATTTSPPTTWDRVLDLTIPSKSPLIFASNADNDMICIRHRLKFVISLSNADGHRSELRCAVHITIVESFAVTEELTTLPAYDESWRSVPYDPHVVEQLCTRTSVSEAGTNEPVLTDAASRLLSSQDSRQQPVSITGWSRMLSLSSAIAAVPDRINDEAEEGSSSSGTTSPSQPVTIPGSNNGSRHNSRRPSMEFEENNDYLLEQQDASFTGRPLWWNGVDLGKVPSYRSVSTLNQGLFSASLPPAYDSLVAAFANVSPRRL